MITKISSGEFTRPANNTAYAAGQMLSQSTTVGVATKITDALSRKGEQGRLMKVLVIKSSTTTANTVFNLYLFNADPGAVMNDAAAGPILTYANRATLAAQVPLPAFLAGATVGICEFIPSSQTVPIACGDVVNDLWAVLIATGAYVPTSAETFHIRLYIEPEGE